MHHLFIHTSDTEGENYIEETFSDFPIDHLFPVGSKLPPDWTYPEREVFLTVQGA